MSLELDPTELGFKRPFNAEVSQVLRLRNRSDVAVAFKVKTTAPKQYCVRPNSGKVEAGSAVEVSVVLQPMKQDPAPDAKCKDKFLVQSIALPADRPFNSWAHIEQTAKSSIQEKKIRVHYLAADDSGANGINGVDHPNDDTTLLSSPAAYTPRPGNAAADDTPLKSEARSTEGNLNDFSEQGSTPGQASGGSRSPSGSAVSAEQKVRLSPGDLTDQSLRRRKADSESKSSVGGPVSMGVPQPAVQSGVPLRVVAFLCLFVFLLTYFFF